MGQFIAILISCLIQNGIPGDRQMDLDLNGFSNFYQTHCNDDGNYGHGYWTLYDPYKIDYSNGCEFMLGRQFGRINYKIGVDYSQMELYSENALTNRYWSLKNWGVTPISLDIKIISKNNFDLSGNVGFKYLKDSNAKLESYTNDVLIEKDETSVSNYIPSIGFNISKKLGDHFALSLTPTYDIVFNNSSTDKKLDLPVPATYVGNYYPDYSSIRGFTIKFGVKYLFDI